MTADLEHEIATSDADDLVLHQVGRRPVDIGVHLLAVAAAVQGVLDTFDSTDPDFPPDRSLCDWYRRANNLPGADPEGICGFGCVDEPACQTSEPEGGWPLMRARRALDALHAALAEVCPGCGGTGWSDDEGWSPEDWQMRAFATGKLKREVHAGLVPCGFCNLGGWDHTDPEPRSSLGRWLDEQRAKQEATS